jgi:hypothetical protein
LYEFTESNAAGVWIPEEPAKETDGTVLDEFSEVAHVFAKPEARVVKNEEVVSEQGTPWTSLKQEMDLYKKYHKDSTKKDKDTSSAEESDEEEDEEQDDSLPQAFYGQQNSDDDEKEYEQNEKQIHKRTKKVVKPKEDSDEEEVDSFSDGVNLDEIPPSVKDAMLQELLASRKTGEKLEESGEDEEEDDDLPLADLGEPIYPDRESPEVKSSNPNKGDDADLQDEGGKGKGKGKKKKGKKGGGGGGWGWKPRPQIIHVPVKVPGWGKKDHNGILEQMVKGSTWERVLNYYHWSRDNQEKGHPGWGWKKAGVGTTLHHNGQGLAEKLFKGSFWERAVKTYGQYKNNNKGKPNKEFGHAHSGLTIDW